MDQQESSSGLVIGIIIGGVLLVFVVVAGVLGFGFYQLRSNAPAMPPPAVEVAEAAVPEPRPAPREEQGPVVAAAPQHQPQGEKAPGPQTPAVKKELQKLQGNWTIVSLEIDGEPRLRKAEKHNLSFQGDTWSWKRRGPWPLRKTFFEITQIGTLRFVDVGGQPKALDLLKTQDTNKIDDPPEGVANPVVTPSNAVIVTIYRVDGDTLHLCYGTDAKRPRELATKEGDGFTYTVWKRDAAKQAPAKGDAGATDKPQS